MSPATTTLHTLDTHSIRRVVELEEENARLLALTESDDSHSLSNDKVLGSRIEALKEELAASQERERKLIHGVDNLHGLLSKFELEAELE
ncbi:hypothetical protein H0H87_009972 [Tephrocybe sp. NHM501043]|nr:hypothetical protein H0H87_009972 [Tephrocybe sp. NHM501043]